MTILIKRPSWHWRLRRFLGFDSTRRAMTTRGVLRIPNTLSFVHLDNDEFLNELIGYMTRSLRPPSRWFRFRRFLGFDSTRRLGSPSDPSHAKSVVPIILRGPALLAPRDEWDFPDWATGQ